MLCKNFCTGFSCYRPWYEHPLNYSFDDNCMSTCCLDGQKKDGNPKFCGEYMGFEGSLCTTSYKDKFILTRYIC